MTIKLYPGERLDDLERNGYKIIQHENKFCFGMDAVLLSGFARVKEGEQVLDLGTGTGIIPILLAGKTRGRHFTGLEIQRESADMAMRSVRYNHLDERISIIEGDIREADTLFRAASFDVITCNPPYMTEHHGLVNPGQPKAIARHEILCTLEDVLTQSARLLKPGGKFYLVHRPFRLRYGAIGTGTKKNASGVSLCGSGTQYGTSGGTSGRKIQNYGGKAVDCIQQARRLYGGNL